MKFPKILPLVFIIILLPGLGKTTAVQSTSFTLEELIDIALKKSPLLAARSGEADALYAGYKASSVWANPQLDIGLGRAKPYDRLFERDTREISVHQDVENPIKKHFRTQALKNSWEASRLQLQDFSLEVIYQVKKHVFQILLLSQTRALLSENLRSIEKIYDLIKARADLGEVKELEAIKLFVETLKARNALNRNETETKIAKDTLNSYLGYVLQPDFNISGSLDYSPLALDENALVEKAIKSHPSLLGKSKGLESAKSRIQYIKWQRLPDFTLTGFTRRELDGTNQGIGISFSLPLWNWKTRELEEAENLFRKEEEEMRAMQMDVTAGIRTRVAYLNLSQQTIRMFMDGLLKQAEESLKIAEFSYKEGEISLMEYLDSQRTRVEILKNYQEALFAFNLEKASLSKALGEEIQ